jgi:hypothetical protein
MAEKLEVCEQCGQAQPETYKCNSCGMVICADCLASRNRTPPCHCIWDNCNGWLEPTE